MKYLWPTLPPVPSRTFCTLPLHLEEKKEKLVLCALLVSLCVCARVVVVAHIWRVEC
jgi:hypothetical protein